MKRIALLLAPAAAVAGIAAAIAPTSGYGPEGAAAAAAAAAPSAKHVRAANPYRGIDNEAAPQLFVDAPDAEALAQGVVWIQYRVENLRIVPVFGKGATTVSPRVGHLHVHVDDLPWWWADPSGTNTVDIAGMPPGEHKVRIELVDADHNTFPGQSKTVKFTVPPRPAGATAGH